jgi:GDP-4-dehydro-6-deoxy-D-mannose reductase
MPKATDPRRALVTGVSGFVGRHLVNQLVAMGWEVCGFDRVIDPRGDLTGVHVHQGDLLNLARVEDVLASCRPSHVFHLAALLGGDRPAPLFEVNVVGTANLFAAMRSTHTSARVLVTSSSAVYGEPARLPVTEDDGFRPTTDYGASKAAQEMVAVSNQCRGMDVVRVRPFNLVGPGQPDRLVVSSIARQIVAAERAGTGVVRIGDTRPRRDYVDVRDAVRAYVAVAEDKSLQDVYNVCSGQSVSVRECLDRLIRLSSIPLRVEHDDHLVRSHDIQEQVGSPARLQGATGWRPHISMDESLAAVLERLRSDHA